MLAAVKSLYATSSLAVKVGGRVGSPLPSQTGVKQGCPLSPTLFGLFLDGLHRYIAIHCPHIGPALSDGTRVSNLQYADDVTLLACSPTHLQVLIDCAIDFCTMLVSSLAPKRPPLCLSPALLLQSHGLVPVWPYSEGYLRRIWVWLFMPDLGCCLRVRPGSKRCGEPGRPSRDSMLGWIVACPLACSRVFVKPASPLWPTTAASSGGCGPWPPARKVSGTNCSWHTLMCCGIFWGLGNRLRKPLHFWSLVALPCRTLGCSSQ